MLRNCPRISYKANFHLQSLGQKEPNHIKIAPQKYDTV